ncbi:MAG: tetratricopeptide repeat protein [Acidobacteria bacterium]|nr:MAG: tetratricopeptide repeat protein [Acidobacteriota bacterium]
MDNDYPRGPQRPFRPLCYHPLHMVRWCLIFAFSGFLLAQNAAELTARFNRAAELQRKGALEEAAHAYESLLEIAPRYAEAYANLGMVLSRLGRHQPAIEANRKAIELAPALTPARMNLGIAYYRAGQFEDAVTAFQDYLARQPGSLPATQLLGVSLFELGRDVEALPHLEQAVAQNSQDPAVLYSLGLVYLRQRNDRVFDLIKRLNASTEAKPAGHLLQGQYHLMQQDYERAILELLEARRLNPLLPRLYYSRGLSYVKSAKYAEAIEAFEKELDLRPKDFSTRYYLAYSLEAAHRPEEALSRLQKALELEPQSPEGNALLGKILFDQGKAAEALPKLELAVKGDPQEPEKRFLLARVYQKLGRREDASREFAEVQRQKTEQLQKTQQYLEKEAGKKP